MTGDHILIIEDDPEKIEFLLTQVLSPRGYLAQTATSGQAGLSAVQAKRPDLVMLNLGLSDVTYTRMLHQLQASGDPPVILLTPAGAESEALRGIRLGACDALVEPLIEEKVAQAIGHVLQQERLNDERDWLVRKLAAENEALEKSLAEARRLHDASKNLLSSLNLSDVMMTVVRAAISLVGAEEGYVLLSDLESGALFLRAYQKADEGNATDLHMQVDDSIARHVLRSGKPVNLSSDDGASINIEWRQRLETISPSVRSLVNIPIRNNQQVIGVIGLDNVISEQSFTPTDVSLLSSLANSAAIAIDNAQSYACTHEKLSNALVEVSTAQHKTDLILQNISEGVFTLDTDLRITSVNPAMERISGWQQSELIGRRFDNIFAPEKDGAKLPPSETIPGKALRTRSSVVTAWHTILRKDRRRIPVTGIAALLKAANASAIGVLAMLRELTAAAQPDGAYHEITDKLPQRDFQLDQLIDETLNTLHLEMGRARSHCHPVTLKPIIAQAVKNFEKATFRSALKVALAPDLPFAMGNESKIELALINLIENALTLGDPQQPIVISAESKDDCVVIAIEGSSLPYAIKEYEDQAVSTSSSNSHNTDGESHQLWWATPQIKYFIARKLIQAQGGQMWTESHPGTRTRFHFSLPKVEVEDVAQAFID